MLIGFISIVYLKQNNSRVTKATKRLWFPTQFVRQSVLETYCHLLQTNSTPLLCLNNFRRPGEVVQFIILFFREKQRLECIVLGFFLCLNTTLGTTAILFW